MNEVVEAETDNGQGLKLTVGKDVHYRDPESGMEWRAAIEKISDDGKRVYLCWASARKSKANQKPGGKKYRYPKKGGNGIWVDVSCIVDTTPSMDATNGEEPE